MINLYSYQAGSGMELIWEKGSSSRLIPRDFIVRLFCSVAEYMNDGIRFLQPSACRLALASAFIFIISELSISLIRLVLILQSAGTLL